MESSAIKELPNEWEMKLDEKLIKNASRRGYLFSLFYEGTLESRKICLYCGGLIEPQEDSLNCVCGKILVLCDNRKLNIDIMFFVHELLLQTKGRIKELPDKWPRIIFENSESNRYNRNLKYFKTLTIKSKLSKSAFSTYVKECSLTKLALFIENIVVESALNSKGILC